MSPTNLVMTRVYLDPKQRAALKRKAREEQAEIADLIRHASNDPPHRSGRRELPPAR